MEPQKAYSFSDPVTRTKILHGALIAGFGAASLFVLNALGTLHFSDPNMTALIAFLIPFLTNVVKEFIAGV